MISRHIYRIDGPLINLLCAKGLNPDQAASLLIPLARAHMPHKLKASYNARYQTRDDLHENHPLVHATKAQINLLERAIRRLQVGDGHGLTKDKIRKLGYSETIIETLIFMLTEAEYDKREEDQIKDLILKANPRTFGKNSASARDEPLQVQKINIAIDINTQHASDGGRTTTVRMNGINDQMPQFARYPQSFPNGRATAPECNRISPERRHTIMLLLNNPPETIVEQMQTLVAKRPVPIDSLVAWTGFTGPMQCEAVGVGYYHIYNYDLREDEPKLAIAIDCEMFKVTP